MAGVENIAKISIEKHDSKDQFLYIWDKSKPLSEIIRDVCKTGGLPPSKVYGLKLIQTATEKTVNSFIDEKNYKNIQHTDCLKITYSVDYFLKNRILPHITNQEKDLQREIGFNDLAEIAADPAFIDALMKTPNHFQVIDVFIQDESLNDRELRALLMTICHLLRKNCISDTSRDFLTKTIWLVQKHTVDTHPPDFLQYALVMLQKILTQKHSIFGEWKEKVIKEVPLHYLMSYIRHKDINNLQYTALLLINTIIKLRKAEQKLHLIKELNLMKNRETIYKHVIEPGDLDKYMQHELYVTQTYLMSLHAKALEREVRIDDESEFSKSEFELADVDNKRITLLMDFDDVDSCNDRNSMDALMQQDSSERLSLVSLMSNSSRMSSVRPSRVSCDLLTNDNSTISCLTVEALRHFKNYHEKHFLQSQIEEKVYEPGIFITSERVVRMLADILDVGVDPPNPKSVFYHPIIFNTTTSSPFLLELFARSMWLLSKTRREMKVSTIEDYPKVMKVLRKQIEMVLERKPKDIKQLTNEMKEVTFEAVLRQWQRENEAETEDLLRNSVDMQALQAKYAAENDRHVRENRLNVLKKGGCFPKIGDKFQKTNREIFVRLSRNERQLDVFDKEAQACEKTGSFSVADITHVAVGRNCKHSHLSAKFPHLVFSVIFNHSEQQVNFIARDKKTACNWIDGFHILAGSAKRSEYYVEELGVLVDMDVRLQIIELQNVPVAKIPPPIPHLPKPVVPPRPKNIGKARKFSKTRSEA